jgi:hypothetical protein
MTRKAVENALTHSQVISISIRNRICNSLNDAVCKAAVFARNTCDTPDIEYCMHIYSCLLFTGCFGCYPLSKGHEGLLPLKFWKLKQLQLPPGNRRNIYVCLAFAITFILKDLMKEKCSFCLNKRFFQAYTSFEHVFGTSAPDHSPGIQRFFRFNFFKLNYGTSCARIIASKKN